MAQAGPHVEQHFGNAEASHGGLLFQGHVSGPLHIHQHVTDTSPERSLERLDSLPEASFDASNKQHVATCLPNTRRDVLAQIRRWADGGSGRRIYWLKGWAGTGKSTIALTVAREYSAKKRLGASFFFSRGGGDLASTRRFAATIAVQLAEASPQLRRHIADAAAATHRIHGLGLYDQWERLILQPLAQLSKEAFPHPLVIVVDALDECDNHDDVSLLIRCLAAAVAVGHVDLRIFVTSRPDQPINVGFGDISIDKHQDFILHDIEQSVVDQDLAVYYKRQLGQIARTARLDAASRSDDAIRMLVQKSCGSFIYAATACRFVRAGGLLAGKRLAHLVSTERLPAKAGTALDQMYLTVLESSLTADLDPEEIAEIRELFQLVMGTVVVLFDALSPANLAMLLDQSKETIVSPLDGLHSLLDVPDEEDRLIRLLHPSFREFLLDSQRCSNTTFCIDAKEAHRHLPEASIIRRMYMHQLPKWIVRAPALSEDWSVHLQTLQGHSSSVKAVAFSPDGRLIVSGSCDNTVRVWDAATGAERRVLQGHSSSVNAVAFSPDSRLIVSGSGDNTLGVWDAATGDNTVRVWDAATGAERRVLQGHSRSVNAVAFSPDGRLIVSGSADKTVRVWDAATGAERRVLQGHSRSVNAVAFSPDGRLIVSGSADNTVRVWDAATGAERRVLQGHSSSVFAVAFSPDGRLIVSGSSDKTVRVWDTATGAERRVLRHSHYVFAVAFSLDGQLIVSGSGDNTVRVWDAATGAERRVLHGHSNYVFAVAFSPDGRFIVSGSADNTVRVWDAATGAEQRVVQGHSNYVRAVAFSPDGRLIVSGSGDNTVQVWDAATGAERRVLYGHSNYVRAIAFSPDGRLI
ncbi:WD40-repeat-containing domain protein, partial [Parachaetomium inaequale]